MNKLPYIFSLIVLLSTVFGTPAAHAQERRGWSPQAKGAVIGGLGGAAAGALINKRNRAVGGVVGGVVGGGVGYAIGKHTDNKRKEQARIAAANRAAAAREAEYRRSLARNNAARQTTTTRTQTATAPANSLVASPTPAMMTNYETQGAGAPGATSPAYLPNDAYGNPSNPYSTSEYRRKSW